MGHTRCRESSRGRGGPGLLCAIHYREADIGLSSGAGDATGQGPSLKLPTALSPLTEDGLEGEVALEAVGPRLLGALKMRMG